MSESTGKFKRPWDTVAETGDVASAVVTYIREQDWVTAVELQRAFEPYMPTRGDHALCLPSDPNLVVWSGMSEALTRILIDLLATERIFLHPSSVLTHMIDGGMLKMPLAKRPPKGGYREPHWAPACFRVMPQKK